jgi:hypothetical protein
MKLSGPLLLLGLILAGCSSMATHFEPGANLARLKHIYVQQNLNDNHGLDAMIVRDLQARGIQAESGPLTLMPRDVKIYLTYEDQWDWDLKDYMISLGITAHDAATDRLLANTRYFRPTAFMKTQEFMIHTVLNRLFDPSAKPNPPVRPAPAKSSKEMEREQDQD